ncbi:hypothetical protein [Microbacterium sp. W4I20]|uniref:hypothetical protein n=1 Tax=Microbacterium sp. W4I20 TaxID=3042262 RepID=UPI002787716A|nr:hypothetical protein [Microbacterium sp. W4I20]MDQ0726960.1 hypothetical protein [Microbacterium sp. W4I20]
MTGFDPRYCRVCGYEPEEAPWGPDGRFGSFDICPCCGVEWGYEDSTFSASVRYRDRWIEQGAGWHDRRTPADGMTTAARLERAWVTAPASPPEEA